MTTPSEQYPQTVKSVSVADNSNIATIVDVFLTNKINAVTLDVAPIIGDEVITLVAGHGTVAGNFLEFWEGNRRSQIKVKTVVTNVVTLDMPLDYTYTIAGATINRTSAAMNIDADPTQAIFSLEPLGGMAFDITRVMVVIVHDAAGDDVKFGSLAALGAGVYMKDTRNGIIRDHFNAKNNGDLKIRAFNLEYSDKAGAGKYSTSWRRTFNGPEKSGAVIRLNPANNDKIEVVIRDDIDALTSFSFIVQGREILL